MAESNDIMFHIESLFPSLHPMVPNKNNPSELPLFNRMQALMQLERQTFSVWFRWLTSDAGEASARQMDAVLRSVDKVTHSLWHLDAMPNSPLQLICGLSVSLGTIVVFRGSLLPGVAALDGGHPVHALPGEDGSFVAVLQRCTHSMIICHPPCSP
jgi:hypothetical protein